MAIGTLERDRFIELLNTTLSPASPVDTLERLHGRDDELDDIEKALAISGRHVFIFGDRGVGKSSLAATAAFKIQSSSRNPVSVSGSPSDTFSSIIRAILFEVDEGSRTGDSQKTVEKSIGVKGYFQQKTTTSEKTNGYDRRAEFSIGEAAEVLKSVADRFPNLVVVVDEFDRIKEANERDKFADLLKHIGDSKIKIRFIFTGIAKVLEELLGAHGSAIRQLHTRELARLSWNGRWDIAIAAAEAFNMTIPEDICIRLAQISDGYPYYVHLIMEKILWRAFDDPTLISEVSWDLFRIGLKDAIASINAELKRPYEKVLLQKSGDFEPILWATANGEQLYTEPKNYWGSYLSVMAQMGKSGVSQSTFRKRIQRLLDADCGPILEVDPFHNQFTRYRENMLRGYVRMQAEVNDVQLSGEELKIPTTVRITTPSKANYGYHGSRPPRGFSKPRTS